MNSFKYINSLQYIHFINSLRYIQLGKVYTLSVDSQILCHFPITAWTLGQKTLIYTLYTMQWKWKIKGKFEEHFQKKITICITNLKDSEKNEAIKIVI